jgi:hypothetical protein
MKGETLMLVPKTADGSRVTIGAQRSLREDKGVSFHTFSLPEDRCVRLLLKNVGKRMPEAEIKEELEALRISVQAVIQLGSKRRDQDPEKDRPLTLHFVVSVVRGPDVAKVRSLTELCGLQYGSSFQVLQSGDWHRVMIYALVDKDRRATTRSGSVRLVANVVREP